MPVVPVSFHELGVGAALGDVAAVEDDDAVALAEGAGLRVDQLAGDYDLRPYEPGDERVILIASPGARRQRVMRRRSAEPDRQGGQDSRSGRDARQPLV